MPTCTIALEVGLLSANVTCAVPVKPGLAFVGATVQVAIPFDCDVIVALKFTRSELTHTNKVAPRSVAVTSCDGLELDANVSAAGLTLIVPPATSTSMFPF